MWCNNVNWNRTEKLYCSMQIREHWCLFRALKVKTNVDWPFKMYWQCFTFVCLFLSFHYLLILSVCWKCISCWHFDVNTLLFPFLVILNWGDLKMLSCIPWGLCGQIYTLETVLNSTLRKTYILNDEIKHLKALYIMALSIFHF